MRQEIESFFLSCAEFGGKKILKVGWAGRKKGEHAVEQAFRKKARKKS